MIYPNVSSTMQGHPPKEFAYSLRWSRVPLLIGLLACWGCSRPNDLPTPPAPPVPSPEPEDEQEAQTEPSIDRLKVDRVVKQWGRDPDVAWDTAITLAHLSKLAYDEGPTRDEPLSALGFSTIRPLKLGSHAGFVAASDDVGVIAFRGTNQEEILDWITNVNIFLLDDLESGRKLHTGFQTAYAGFKDEIDEVLAAENPSRVWITGHSLGGAMAACCAYDRQKRREPITGVVTFGQPRIGNEALAEYLDAELGDRYLRLMNEGDPVPILPPCFGIKLPGYWHSGRRAWFLWGQLLTTEGPTVYSQRAPGTPDEPEEVQEPTGSDSFRSMTEEDFVELQRQLKEMRGDEPPQLASAAPDGPTAESAPRTQAFVGLIARFVMDRIGEHDMDEYLKKMNDQREMASNP